ncbi:nitrilase-related carbon-nitrogen hydrolase [Peribacillus simplex]|uniref:nitrilase-related carbon-nitrogen hydrolase n=1 Tax=Peribacillus simplex TaxID=1478 RepID=UPI003D27E896
MLHIVAEWPLARETHWNILLRARAIENQMYVVASNIAGTQLGVEFAGSSQIVDPWRVRVPNTICNEIRIIYFSVLYLKAT